LALRGGGIPEYKERYKYRAENTESLRRNLIPVLDDIMSAGREEIDSLVEFSDALVKAQMDYGLRYQICSALVAYARAREDRDLLIKELYMTAMALYEFQGLAEEAEDGHFRWRMRLLFGEAAGYIRVYDEIEDPETRGYIHRAMGNMALGYDGRNAKSAKKKLDVLRRSIQVLTDPAYHEKTPSLPWDLYIYKSHQERTTLLTFLRSGAATVKDLQEVMESAQFVYDRQMARAEKEGVPLQPQWMYAYYAASYHCGVHTLPELLLNLEKIYASVSPFDYSYQGQYGNLYLPSIYSSYLRKDKKLLEGKKQVMLMMYRRQQAYLKGLPPGKSNDRLYFYLSGCLQYYVEYPGENCFRDFVMEVAGNCLPENQEHSLKVSAIAEMIFREAMKSEPQSLVGVRGTKSPEELKGREEEISRFLYECCILHDIGKLKLLNLYEVSSRGWIEEENELHELHSVFGAKILTSCPSTQDYAAVALGHHRWYDGKGGYSRDYDRTKEQDAALIDIIIIGDYIDRRCNYVGSYQGDIISVDEAFGDLEKGSGSKFAPHFVKLALKFKEEIQELYACK